MVFCSLMFFVTAILALAVRQLSFALAKGSLFEPLRKFIRRGMERGTPGFTLLNELFTCKLCMVMQVSLWTVVIPTICLFHTDSVHVLLGLSVAWIALLESHVGILFAFLYGMGVSGLALWLWHLIEYPAHRYETLAIEHLEVQGLVAMYEEMQRNSGGEILTASSSEALSLSAFREFMISLNKRCAGIGCGYVRRTCRSKQVAEWVRVWAESSPDYAHLSHKLQHVLLRALPGYFRKYSKYDNEKIENEKAFLELFRKISRELAS